MTDCLLVLLGMLFLCQVSLPFSFFFFSSLDFHSLFKSHAFTLTVYSTCRHPQPIRNQISRSPFLSTDIHEYKYTCTYSFSECLSETKLNINLCSTVRSPNDSNGVRKRAGESKQMNANECKWSTPISIDHFLEIHYSEEGVLHFMFVW